MDRKDHDPGPDARLLERHRSGDPGAFEAIVREHRRAVYQLARRYTRDHAAADEAAQETFVRAWRALDGFRGESAIRTWLFRIAINVLRSAAVRPGARDEAIDAVPEAADPAEGADEALRRGEDGRRIREAVAALPPRQRDVVILKAFSEMTYEEVARALGLTEGAVKAHFHQAVHNLRRLVGGRGEGR